MTTVAKRLLLRDLSLREIPSGEESSYPFSVPAVAALAETRLEFSSAITIFVGENGSGKSTLLEGIAAAAGSVAAGSARIDHDPWLAHANRLGRALRLTWSRRTKRGFFMRAEDFIGFNKSMQQNLDELKREMAAVGETGAHSAYAVALGKSAYAGQIGAIRRRYGDDLDAASHGESFLRFFLSRFTADGLYLLDEPETPLSPRRQLSLISLLHDMTVNGGSQFVIATHSPLLMSIPGASLVSFDDGRLQHVAYDTIDHVALTRDFLQNPDAFLRHLWPREERAHDD